LALWFLLPAAIANATPILVAKMPGLKQLDAPIDGGRKWRGKELFGPHKTWRGIVSGMVIATLILWLQIMCYKQFDWARTAADSVRYDHLSLWLGPVFGLGALGGDALKSFFKRQFGVSSGESWFPFDQLDYIIGSLALSLFFVRLTVVQYVLICLVWFVMHLVASYIGYLLKLKDSPI
jgi:CDP-2,3-bis-(O-geranylgeranyl)-sn-glycerol synthase